MTEENSPPPATNATPSGNQNLIIGLVLGAVVLLLFFLVIQMTGGGFGGGSSETEEVKRLKAQRDSLVSHRESNVNGGANAQALAERLKKDSTDLANLVSQLQAALAQSTTDLNTTRSAYTIANRDVMQLRQQLDTAQASAAEATDLKRRLTEAQAFQTQAEARAADLLQQLNAAPSANELAVLRNQYNQAIQQGDSHKKQVGELQTLMKTMQPKDAAADQELAALKERASTLLTENNQLRYDLQKMRAELDRSRLFAEKVEDLPAAAKGLYAELAKLDAASPAELETEYNRIGQELKATVLDTVKFQTGSSRVDLDKVEEIRRAVQASGVDSLFLVVGYASKSGSAEQNRKLSADRATTIASVANYEKKSSQRVQAVFLAETDRFSPADESQNQICEIWEIQK